MDTLPEPDAYPRIDLPSLDEVLLEAGLDGERPPPRALILCGLSLAAAAATAALWPDAWRRFAGFAWVLALVPVFLLSYYRGWKGAAVAAAGAMALLVGYEVVVRGGLGHEVDWWILSVAAALLIPSTLGAGALSESLRRQREMAVVLAYRDPLTGLPNRRFLREHALKILALSDRHSTRVAMLSLDLGGLAPVNQRFGHEAGDGVLKEVATRLRRRVRPADTVAKMTGDEYAVFLSELQDGPDALDVAARLRKAASLPVFVQGDAIHVDPCVGIALYPDHADSFDRLLSKASHAREVARREDVPVRVYSHLPREAPARGDALEDELGSAIEARALELHYQPVVALGSGISQGMEALVRWQHPELGLLTAGQFVPLAEKTGLGRRLDRLVLEQAVHRLAEWSSGPWEWVSVNLSTASVEDPALGEYVEELLDERGVDGARLVLEITERTAIRDFHRVSEALSRLKRRGVRFAIDDFGTGHSSLAYLEQIDVDMVKLDLIFVQRIVSERRARDLLSGILALARRLDLQVVAEGVETEEQYRELARSRCDLAQGYYIGRPAPPQELRLSAST